MPPSAAALALDQQVAPLPVLRRLPAPVVEPRPALRLVPEPASPPPGHGAMTLPLTVERTPRMRAAAPADGTPEPVRAGEEDLPEPHLWAAQFVQAAVEVAAGVRAPSQLVRWTTLDVHATLARRSALARRTARGAAPVGRRALVRSIRTSTPRDRVREVCAVVSEGNRARAVAFRMEAFERRWRVTALEMG